MAYKASGIALPIFSLPSNYGIGTIGQEAKNFIDFLADSGFSYWSILPLGPTSFADSPFQCFSARALNHYFIDLDDLIEKDLLKKRDLEKYVWCEDERKVDYHLIYTNRSKVLKKAFNRFKRGSGDYQRGYTSFLRKNEFLDYACFMVLKELNKGKPWPKFEKGYNEYSFKAFKKIKHQYWNEVEFYLWTQYIFLKQWNSLKKYAAEKGIKIIGEEPFYLAFDSIDVYKHHRNFKLNSHNQMEKVGGYPPDCFSPDGQVWGSPIYDFDYMAKHDYRFFKNRLNFALGLYDQVILNHFRGFFNYYSLKVGSKNGLNGEFYPGPGTEMCDALVRDKSEKIIAEHVGYSSPLIEEFLKNRQVPEISVLEFSLVGQENFPLPEDYPYQTIVYSTRHDNEPLCSYILSLNSKEKLHMRSILDKSCYQLGVKLVDDTIDGWCKTILELGLSSQAKLMIINMPDLLLETHRGRINTPNTINNNWTYRIGKNDLTKELSQKLKELNHYYGRC